MTSILGRFWRFWCRSIAKIESRRSTPKSSRTEPYWSISLTCFDPHVITNLHHRGNINPIVLLLRLQLRRCSLLLLPVLLLIRILHSGTPEPRIEICPRIELVPHRFWWFWCRWEAETESFPTTPKSYKVDTWSYFAPVIIPRRERTTEVRTNFGFQYHGPNFRQVPSRIFTLE